MLKIINNIKKKKIPLDDYINTCLYKYKSSYYEKKKIFGPRGDFITSPYISSIFGEIIAIYITNYFLEKKLYSFSILEIGAGEGVMARDIINTINKFKNINFSYFILEKSENLKKKQKKNLNKLKVNWIKSLDDLKCKNLFIVSNELLDAFPIKHLKKIKNDWYEKYVCYDNKKNKIISEYAKLKNKNQKIFKLVSKNNDFIEFSPLVIQFLNQIIKVLKKNKNNCFLTFDYGYQDNKFKNTLQGLKNHKKVSIFEDPGNVDITYLINFNLIKKIFNNKSNFNNIIMSQSEFLTRAGIIERLRQATNILTSEKDKLKLEMSVDRLIHPKKMGNLFKCLIVTNAN